MKYKFLAKIGMILIFYLIKSSNSQDKFIFQSDIHFKFDNSFEIEQNNLAQIKLNEKNQESNTYIYHQLSFGPDRFNQPKSSLCFQNSKFNVIFTQNEISQAENITITFWIRFKNTEQVMNNKQQNIFTILNDNNEIIFALYQNKIIWFSKETEFESEFNLIGSELPLFTEKLLEQGDSLYSDWKLVGISNNYVKNSLNYLQLYLNGISFNSKFNVENKLITIKQIVIGQNYLNSEQQFQGCLDDLKFYKNENSFKIYDDITQKMNPFFDFELKQYGTPLPQAFHQLKFDEIQRTECGLGIAFDDYPFRINAQDMIQQNKEMQLLQNQVVNTLAVGGWVFFSLTNPKQINLDQIQIKLATIVRIRSNNEYSNALYCKDKFLQIQLQFTQQDQKIMFQTCDNNNFNYMQNEIFPVFQQWFYVYFQVKKENGIGKFLYLIYNQELKQNYNYPLIKEFTAKPYFPLFSELVIEVGKESLNPNEDQPIAFNGQIQNMRIYFSDNFFVMNDQVNKFSQLFGKAPNPPTFQCSVLKSSDDIKNRNCINWITYQDPNGEFQLDNKFLKITTTEYGIGFWFFFDTQKPLLLPDYSSKFINVIRFRQTILSNLQQANGDNNIAIYIFKNQTQENFQLYLVSYNINQSFYLEEITNQQNLLVEKQWAYIFVGYSAYLKKIHIYFFQQQSELIQSETYRELIDQTHFEIDQTFMTIGNDANYQDQFINQMTNFNGQIIDLKIFNNLNFINQQVQEIYDSAEPKIFNTNDCKLSQPCIETSNQYGNAIIGDLCRDNNQNYYKCCSSCPNQISNCWQRIKSSNDQCQELTNEQKYGHEIQNYQCQLNENIQISLDSTVPCSEIKDKEIYIGDICNTYIEFFQKIVSLPCCNICSQNTNLISCFQLSGCTSDDISQKIEGNFLENFYQHPCSDIDHIVDLVNDTKTFRRICCSQCEIGFGSCWQQKCYFEQKRILFPIIPLRGLEEAQWFQSLYQFNSNPKLARQLYIRNAIKSIQPNYPELFNILCPNIVNNIQNCINVDIQNNQQCILCQENFTLSINYQNCFQSQNQNCIQDQFNSSYYKQIIESNGKIYSFCKQCPFPCYTCINQQQIIQNISSLCIECLPLHFFDQNNAQIFQVSQSLNYSYSYCIACMIGCIKCQSSSDCQQCNNILYHLVNNSNSLYKCCPFECSSCNIFQNSSKLYCTECLDSSKYLDFIISQNEQIEEGVSFGECIDFYSPCLLLNSNYKLTANIFIEYADHTINKCQQNCPQNISYEVGIFQDINGNGFYECMPIPNQCNEISNCVDCKYYQNADKYCKKCDSNFFLYKSQECVDQCPEGMINDSDSSCQKCHFSCKICLTPFNASSCLQCINDYFLDYQNDQASELIQEAKCIMKGKNCSNGYYQLQPSEIINQPNPPHTLNKCISQCPEELDMVQDPYYYCINSLKTCYDRFKDNCINCTLDKCTQCYQNVSENQIFYLNKNQTACVQFCLNDEFLNEISNQCVEAKDCGQDYYANLKSQSLDQNKCLFNNCINPSQLQKIKQNQTFSNICVICDNSCEPGFCKYSDTLICTKCNIGYWEDKLKDDDIEFKCITTQQSCSGKNQIDQAFIKVPKEVQSGFSDYYDSCQSSCPQYIPNKLKILSDFCIKCHLDCYENLCQNENFDQCLRCSNQNKFLNSYMSGIGKTAIKIQISNCIDNITPCKQFGWKKYLYNPLIINIIFDIYQNECVDQCPTYMYSDLNSICQLCTIKNCTECYIDQNSQFTQCKHCINIILNLENQDSKCIDDCTYTVTNKALYTGINLNKFSECMACDKSCLRCIFSDKNYCIECHFSKTIYDSMYNDLQYHQQYLKQYPGQQFGLCVNSTDCFPNYAIDKYSTQTKNTNICIDQCPFPLQPDQTSRECKNCYIMCATGKCKYSNDFKSCYQCINAKQFILEYEKDSQNVITGSCNYDPKQCNSQKNVENYIGIPIEYNQGKSYSECIQNDSCPSSNGSILIPNKYKICYPCDNTCLPGQCKFGQDPSSCIQCNISNFFLQSFKENNTFYGFCLQSSELCPSVAIKYSSNLNLDLELFPQVDQCISNCPFDSLLVADIYKLCQRCHSDCLEKFCQMSVNNERCTKCAQSDKFLLKEGNQNYGRCVHSSNCIVAFNQTCLDVCPQGYFLENEINKICIPCHQDCKFGQCIKGLSSLSCTECQNDNFFLLILNQTQEGISFGQCVYSQICYLNKLASVQKNYDDQQSINKCDKQCPINLVINYQYICKKCYIKCAEGFCTLSESQMHCTKCKQQDILSSENVGQCYNSALLCSFGAQLAENSSMINRCVSQCSSINATSTFLQEEKKICTKCNQFCQTCDGIRTSNCLSCNQGYSLREKYCCLEICNACEEFNQNQCISCIQTMFMDEQQKICRPCLYDQEKYFLKTVYLQQSSGPLFKTINSQLDKINSVQLDSLQQQITTFEQLQQITKKNQKQSFEKFELKCIQIKTVKANISAIQSPLKFLLGIEEFGNLTEYIVYEPQTFLQISIINDYFNIQSFSVQKQYEQSFNSPIEIDITYFTQNAIKNQTLLNITIDLPQHFSQENGEYVLSQQTFILNLTQYVRCDEIHYFNLTKCPIDDGKFKKIDASVHFTDKRNQILVQFYGDAEPLVWDNLQKTIKIANISGLNSSQYDYNIERIGQQHFLINLNFSIEISESPIITVEFDQMHESMFTINKENYLLNQEFEKLSLQDSFITSQNPQQLERITFKILNFASQCGLLVSSLISYGQFGNAIVLMNIGLIELLKFLSISYPPNADEALQNIRLLPPNFIFGKTLNIKELYEDAKKIPQSFQKQNVNPYILNNLNERLIQLVFFIILGLIIYLIDKCKTQNLYNQNYIDNKSSVLKTLFKMLIWNTIYQICINYYMKIIFFAYCQTFFITFSAMISIINYFLGVLFIILNLWLIIHILLIIFIENKIQNGLAEEDKQQQKEQFKSNFKCNDMNLRRNQKQAYIQIYLQKWIYNNGIFLTTLKRLWANLMIRYIPRDMNEKIKFVEMYKILYLIFNSQKKIQQYFILISIIKINLVCFFIVAFSKFNILQLIFSTFIILSYLILLVVYDPFKAKFDKILALCIEIFLFFAYLAATILGIKNDMKSSNKKIFGIIIQICCYSMMAFITIQMIRNLIQAALFHIKKRRNNQQFNKNVKQQQQQQIPNEDISLQQSKNEEKSPENIMTTLNYKNEQSPIKQMTISNQKLLTKEQFIKMQQQERKNLQAFSRERFISFQKQRLQGKNNIYISGKIDPSISAFNPIKKRREIDCFSLPEEKQDDLINKQQYQYSNMSNLEKIIYDVDQANQKLQKLSQLNQIQLCDEKADILEVSINLHQNQKQNTHKQRKKKKKQYNLQ